MRARGELTELRAADLRFTPEEAAAFLNDVMGLAIPVDEVAALETRTEGWIAGLQLAALSMQGRTDVSGFIAAFAGDDRYIVDYLAEEVLHRQPAAVRDFLLKTSILDRLGGGLCDAITGRQDGRAMLEHLERGNLFVVPLDDSRHWYRYHHLFADVLRAHLGEELPGELSALHDGRALVRAERRHDRCHPPRAGRRRLRARGGPGRAGVHCYAPEPPGGHPAGLAADAPGRDGPRQARAKCPVWLSTAVQRCARWGGGSTAGR